MSNCTRIISQESMKLQNESGRWEKLPCIRFFLFGAGTRIEEQTDMSSGPSRPAAGGRWTGCTDWAGTIHSSGADKTVDSGTSAMMTVYFREQEKLLCLFSANLKKQAFYLGFCISMQPVKLLV